MASRPRQRRQRPRLTYGLPYVDSHARRIPYASSVRDAAAMATQILEPIIDDDTVDDEAESRSDEERFGWPIPGLAS